MVFAIGTNAALPVITSAAGAGGFPGVPMAYVLTATNSPFSYAATNLPPGLSINTATGVISGTPTTTGVYAVGVSAANSVGTSSGIVTFQLGTNYRPEIVTSAAAAGGIVGLPTSYQVTVGTLFTGNTISASNLPPGMTFNSSTNTISGASTSAGTFTTGIYVNGNIGGNDPYSDLIAWVTFNFSAGPPSAPVFTSAAGAGGTVGSAFSYAVAASRAPTAFAASGLPAGLSFNAATRHDLRARPWPPERTRSS